MELIDISIERLQVHPHQSSVMKPRTLAKLIKHIEATGWYEPLAVRRRSQGASETHYEVINGHSRLRALRFLHKSTVSCVVSDIDDVQTLLLLATLNRLQGVEVPERRPLLLEQLLATMQVEELGDLLPDHRKLIERVHALMSALGDESQELSEVPPKALPSAILSFVMDKADAGDVDLALDVILRGRATKPMSRSEALTVLAREFLFRLKPAMVA